MIFDNAQMNSSVEGSLTTRELIAYYWRQDWLREFVLATVLALMILAMIISVTIVIQRPEASSIKNEMKSNSAVSLAKIDSDSTATLS
jgi:5-bromo-4-chloroindolyl phosphate hydrolysis protein